MRAMVVVRSEGSSALEFQDVDPPTPGPGQVAIQMEATAVSFGDIEMLHGRYHTPRKPPIIPGNDVVGTIVSLGDGLVSFEVGQRVTAIPVTGSYADIVIAPSAATWLLPSSVGTATAAAFPSNGVTAYNLCTLAGHLNANERVLIHAAAGGIGTTAVQIARVLGAGMIIGTVGSPDKFALARELGCDHVIDYRTEDFEERVGAYTEGGGVDLILDSIGGEVTAKSMNVLAPWGRIVLYGMSSGSPGAVATNVLHAGNRAALGYSTGGYRYHKPEALTDAGTRVLEMIIRGDVRMIVGAVMPLSQANEALALVESRTSTGRVVLTSSEDTDG